VNKIILQDYYIDMCPAILRRDKVKYIPKEALRMQNRYGGAIYLPKGHGIADLFNFFNANKDTIKSVTDTVSNVASAAASVGKLATDTAKGVEQIKALRQQNLQLAKQPITETALNNILSTEEGVPAASIRKTVWAPKKGSGFYQV
jgi:hypothetical protein